MDQRFKQLKVWVEEVLSIADADLSPASSDASFRRYFRVQHGPKSFVIMDAPPDKEDCEPFIKISVALASFGLNVPQVLAKDLRQGFLLLSDLGSEQYLPLLDDDSVDVLYADAITALVNMQVRAVASKVVLPVYDFDLLMTEMRLFKDWLLAQQLGIQLNNEQADALDKVFVWLAQQALAQPQVWVHRDYHSRNLMRTALANPGVLDFQDAVLGPLTYDLVSLLKDCYISWPRQQVEAWLANYLRQIQAAGLAMDVDYAQLQVWFDCMGVQRHLKATGIFARLNIRDGKPGYLADIPRTLAYIVEVSEQQPELSFLAALLRTDVLPRLRGRIS